MKPLTASFINDLNKETLSILETCKVLNQDAEFIQKINTYVSPQVSKGLLLKAEHFFVSDIIELYDRELEKRMKNHNLCWHIIMMLCGTTILRIKILLMN